MEYDIGIIGAGVAGCFAALRLAEKYKNLKVVLFELGPPPPNWIRKDPIKVKRRRRQLEGWFGCFPTGDGKVYPDNLNLADEFADGRRVNSIKKWFESQLNEVAQPKLTKQKQPNSIVQKKIKELNYELSVHDYHQWYPDDIHQLSRNIADKIEAAGNIDVHFDTEVYDFLKNGKVFTIHTSNSDFQCKKVILNVGRSSWRWVNKLYNNLGILNETEEVEYGFKLELPAQYMKEYNKSHCSLIGSKYTIGPLSWKGSVIQEDHADVTLAAFRSNEDRWKTDKVFFSLMSKIKMKDPCVQLDRISKLAFLLSGDRVGRERVKMFLKGDSQLALIPEFKWLAQAFKDIEPLFPNIITRGYLHAPDIKPVMANINIGTNLETEVKGLFVAGESANLIGIGAAGISGGIAAEGAAK